ncbi:RluA family pseudouridine synthase [Sediminitomix flava]|nr:RluA family pseudouridine synthase [Sediminitomix flava]
MNIIQSHTIPANPPRLRLLDYSLEVIDTIVSRNGIKKALKKGALRLNGKMASGSEWIEEGLVITLIDLEEKAPKVFPLQLDVLYEDDDLAVIYKPAGIMVSGNAFRTIENALQGNLKPSEAKDALKWPKPVHRLDAPTSGLLVIAKSVKARVELGKQFEQKTIKKRYQAVVTGKLSEERGHIYTPIEGKECHSEFIVEKCVRSLSNEYLSLVSLFPHTGKTHQLRIHMSESGHPIMGDQMYGKEGKMLKGKGLFLTAVELWFPHPITQKVMQIGVKTPNKFHSLLEREEERWKKFKEGK